MIQADIGGGARVDPGSGVQRPGYMIRDFVLTSPQGKDVLISSFRGQTNLVIVFTGYSDALFAFLDEVSRHCSEFAEQEALILAILPYRQEERILPNSPLILGLHDETLRAHHLSGAIDENGRPVPVVYLTDRFGEILSTYVVPNQALPPGVEEVLRKLEFVNHQCPECEPPEWPR